MRETAGSVRPAQLFRLSLSAYVHAFSNWQMEFDEMSRHLFISVPVAVKDAVNERRPEMPTRRSLHLHGQLQRRLKAACTGSPAGNHLPC